MDPGKVQKLLDQFCHISTIPVCILGRNRCTTSYFEQLKNEPHFGLKTIYFLSILVLTFEKLDCGLHLET